MITIQPKGVQEAIETPFNDFSRIILKQKGIVRLNFLFPFFLFFTDMKVWHAKSELLLVYAPEVPKI